MVSDGVADGFQPSFHIGRDAAVAAAAAAVGDSSCWGRGRFADGQQCD